MPEAGTVSRIGLMFSARKLRTAAMNGDVGRVRSLLAQGANPNAQDNHGWTALRFAVNSDEPEIVRLLVGSGADPSMQDKFGTSPVHAAMTVKSARAFEALRQENVDFNVRNGSGKTPLQAISEDIEVLQNSQFPEMRATGTQLLAMRVLLLIHLSGRSN